ncbi:abortive infection family protein [Dietzia sp. CW19]|uniref:abortive infection family protein n=1 Tax=Dietzia sp. CW19 TaxID=1630634 RepID=UPI0015FE0A96|nr:abortive infection family protein [Dietzia sp. CW19]MBB1051199.1 abortive infection family protein [Dietzia sp. CW19]
MDDVKAGQKDLVSRRVRSAIRDEMSGTHLRDIQTMWEDEGFAPTPLDEPIGGQRVTLFQEYLDSVDWASPLHVQRALRVFTVAIDHLVDPIPETSEYAERTLRRLRRLLKSDGIELNTAGEFLPRSSWPVSPDLLASIDDPDVILDHLKRLDRAVAADDPAQVIGTAKELVESTAKLVLLSCGEKVDGGEDLPALTRRAQILLGIHPESIAAGPDGLGGVKKILGAASTVTSGVAELRNRGFGTGHGGHERPVGLHRRHARLAVNAARLWCEFVLDTLSDPRAPWREK